MRQYLFWFSLFVLAMVDSPAAYAEAHQAEITLAPPLLSAELLPPIGQIQGSGDVSPYLNQVVAFRGVVTGLFEYRNLAGIRYYTIFVQDPPGLEDGDPATSDGIAVFHGRRRPAVAIGDLVRVTGRVIEYYGLTEIADAGLELVVESRNHPLPEAVILDPPAGNAAAAAYYEALEGMRVMVPGAALVVGPTYSSCGLAVVRPDSGLERVLRHRADDPVGQVIHVLHTTNVDCTGFPQASSGDQIQGLTGPLTYHFDEFRIIHQEPAALIVTAGPRSPAPVAPVAGQGQFSLASFNLENYFDTIDDTGTDAEPKPSAAELAIQRTKLAYAIGQTLACPTIVGVQEVEKESLLLELVAEVVSYCAFSYEISHLDSPDARGIDVALLSDPRRVTILGVSLHQRCTPIQTGISDRTINCPADHHPLSSRPPLQVDVLVDEQPFTLFVNHFKSKRGGEAETEPQRLAQAELITELVNHLLDVDSTANVVVMGDFNDYFDSLTMRIMTTGQGRLVNVLAQAPPEERYTYIFAGASQLLDSILVSPALVDRVLTGTILHVNADYAFSMETDISPAGLPYRSSDHDIPFLILQLDDDTGGPGLSADRPPWLWLVVALIGGLTIVAVGTAGAVILRRHQSRQALE